MPICNINAASDTGGTEGNGCKTDGSICDDKEGPGMYGSGGTYTINYYPNGGTVPTSCPASYNAGFSKTINCTPSKTSNKFFGWCTDAALTQSCSTTISITTTTSGNKSFYAKWESNAGGCSDFHGEGCQSEIITDPIGGLVDEYTYEFHCDVQMPGYVTNDFVLCKFDSVSYGNIASTECNAGDKCVKQGYSFSWPCIVCEGTPSAITKIYPKWTANKYTVIYPRMRDSVMHVSG
ncbi:MAG: InlB B-repeat-containing protein [Alphaproteobacteria bacterium]|nr:InlB B-repeat-containing protein [Alphaproteobacteria bacterium]